MSEQKDHDLIYNWNKHGNIDFLQNVDEVNFTDETLRDGLQSPSVVEPNLPDKKRMIHLQNELGIQSSDVGYPGESVKVIDDVIELADYVSSENLDIQLSCTAGLSREDIDPIKGISNQSGIPIEVGMFVGSSPIRKYAEGTELDKLVKQTEEAVNYAVKSGLKVMFVMEDSTRSRPETLKKLTAAAIDNGVDRICLSDTVGHIHPPGVRALIDHMSDFISGKNNSIKLDWHGHRDRSLSVINSLTAIDAGVNRVHGTALGMGERVGNTSLDILLINLKLFEVIDNDLSELPEYCELVSKACSFDIPDNYPVFGKDAFRTGTGYHASAVLKAKRKGDSWLADKVYSGVPASLVGLSQEIEIGPMSNLSNVYHWLENSDVEKDEELAKFILEEAKNSKRVLSDLEIWEKVEDFLP